MALVVKDRVRQTSSTTGTGTLTLNGTVTGFQPFSVIGDGNTTYYTIVDASAGTWEVGVGTYTASGTTLSRDTVFESSNSNNLVNFGVGAKDVFVTYPAERSVYTDGAGTVITPATASVLGVASGGTGQSTYTNGQLLIGNTTGNTLTKATLTAGTGISITNGTGSITIAATSTADVVGPASATDNAVVRFDGTTGKLVQNSSATITDGGKLTANGGIATRATSTASASSLTPDVSTTDLYAYTALAANLAIAVPTGTPANGDKLLFRFLDNGVSRTITFTGGVSGGFRPIGVTLTSSGSDFTFATTINKLTYIGAIYNADAARWDIVALTTQA